jgi:hypothetical protein
LFIFLISFQADEFDQYTWARRHTKDGWRERYRKNQERLDNRIAEIVEGNPPAPDGKGQYKYRRYGRIDQDAELIADNNEFVELGAEEGGYSATDDEDGPVRTKRMNAQPQEEEEEEDEGQSIVHRPGASPNTRNQDPEPPEEAIAEREPETGPLARVATQRGGASLSGAPASKGRRIVSPTFPCSRLSLAIARFRSARNSLWRNLFPMTSMRPYEGPR